MQEAIPCGIEGSAISKKHAYTMSNDLEDEAILPAS